MPRHTTGRKLDHYFVPFPLVHDTLLETSAEAPALKFDSKLLIDSIPSCDDEAGTRGVTTVAVDVLSGGVCLKQGKLPGWQTISVSIPGKAPSAQHPSVSHLRVGSGVTTQQYTQPFLFPQPRQLES